MRRLVILLVCVIALVGLPACGGSSAGGTTRTVLTDFNYDEVAGSYLGYFPAVTPVHPGDTIDFRQAWTGEPHTVTFGTAVKAVGDIVEPYLTGTKPVPNDEPPDLQDATSKLPEIFGTSASNDVTNVNQAGAQPCYLDAGPIPDAACPKRAEPAFNGRQFLFNSGIIRYEGNNGNKFTMKLAADIAPGRYYYYCLLHGPGMAGYLDVKPTVTVIPSAGAERATALKEVDKATKRLLVQHRDSLSGKDKPANVDIVAGTQSNGPPTFPEAFTDEFYPKTAHAKVGQKVTWYVSGHVVAFDVPRYEPLVLFGKDGTVSTNPRASKEVAGPPPTEVPGGDPNNGPTMAVDVGNYDGGHFISSGLPDNDLLYSVTFTKPGTYQYACLVHPRMIGTLVVSR